MWREKDVRQGEIAEKVGALNKISRRNRESDESEDGRRMQQT